MTTENASAAYRILGRLLSWDEQDLADRASAFDRAMGIGDSVQAKGRVNAQCEVAAREPIQDVVAALPPLLGRRRMGVQSGSRQIDRAGHQQLPDVDGRHEPARFAVQRKQAARAQTGKALLKVSFPAAS